MSAAPAMPAEDRDLFLHGQCAALAAAHQNAFPQLKFGLHWQQLPDGEAETISWEDHGELWDGQPMYRAQHVFTHDDHWAYDAAGAHPMPFHGWDDSEFELTLADVEATGMLEPGYMPDEAFVRTFLPVRDDRPGR